MSEESNKKPDIKEFNFFTQTPVKRSPPLLDQFKLFGSQFSPYLGKVFQKELKLGSEVDVISQGPSSVGELLGFHRGGCLISYRLDQGDEVFMRFTPALSYRLLTLSLGGGEKAPLSQPHRELTPTEVKVVKHIAELIWTELAAQLGGLSGQIKEILARGDLYLGKSPRSPLVVWEFMIAIGGMGGCLGVAFEPAKS